MNCNHISDVWFGGGAAEYGVLYISSSGNTCLIDATWHFNLCEDGEHIFGINNELTCESCGYSKQPPKPILESVTYNSVTLVKDEIYEYSMDGIIWQSNNVFEGLSENSTYMFFQRVKESENAFASDPSDFLVVSLKATQVVPNAPNVSSYTDTTVTLIPLDGAEYSADGTTWQQSNVFENLLPATEYTFYQRYAETDTHYASEASAALVVKTKELYNHIVVSSLPNKISYLEEEEDFDETGGKISLCYPDGTTEIIDMTADMVTGFDNTIVGEQTLTVTFDGLTATFTVEIVAKPVLGTWKHDSTGWWYQNADGTYPASCWKEIDDVWYYFNASGYIVTGWQSIGGVWYYFNTSGAMVTGWFASGSTWYYFNASGAMVTGWQSIDGTWYYFAGSGAMVANRWVGNYYLQADGSMATNMWIGSYYVGADGAWVP